MKRKRISINVSFLFLAFFYFTSCFSDKSVSELKLKYVYGDLNINQEIKNVYDSLYVYLSKEGKSEILSSDSLSFQSNNPFSFQAIDSGWYYNELFFNKNQKYLDTVIVEVERLKRVKIVAVGKKTFPVMGQSIEGHCFHLIFSDNIKKEFHVYNRELLFSAKYNIIVYEKILKRDRIMAIDSLLIL